MLKAAGRATHLNLWVCVAHRSALLLPWPALDVDGATPGTCLHPQQGFQLAMTRALGHRLLADYGVIPEPSGALCLCDNNWTDWTNCATSSLAFSIRAAPLQIKTRLRAAAGSTCARG